MAICSFSIRRVAGERDHLHAVAQRPRDLVEHVRGRDEHDTAQVERHAEIVVAERVVLLRVEHFEQRGARIALDAGAELVDLVEHHHAVARARLADRLDDVARQRADIGAAMAADLGLVVHAAQADAHELAVHGARDRLAERRLADAGRPDEAQDRRLAVRRELAHRQVLDDAPLDLVEPVVVLVEDAARLADVDRRLLRNAPGQLDQPIEIGADHAVLGRRVRHALQPAQLLARLLLDLLRHVGLGDRLLELGDVRPPCPPRLRRAGAGSPPSARAAAPRAGARRAPPWSACRSRRTGAAPRCAAPAGARPSPCAHETSMVSRISCFSSGFMSM